MPRTINLRLKRHITKLVAVAGLIVASSPFTFGQNVSVSAKLDSMLIFIGGQIDLTFEVSQPQNADVKFPLLVDTVSKSVEIVEIGKIDTSKAGDNRLLLTQKYRITSFDSGVHLIPAIRFELADAQAGQFMETQPMALKVVNPFESVDPQKGIYDIKQPLNTPFSLAELLQYLPYILTFILIVGAIVVFFIWKFNRKLLPFVAKEKPIEPPHVIALRELERIKNEKLWQKSQVKQFYIQTSDAVRQYIEARFVIPAMEQTSDEILATLKKEDSIDRECHKNLQQLLFTSDLVKFAKMQPLQDENDLSLMNAFFFVNQTKLEPQKTLEELKLSETEDLKTN
ncbi:MAG: hypothetical protein QM786_09310 [Breznakibacter sp.]